jgi:hypothetical protein
MEGKDMVIERLPNGKIKPKRFNLDDIKEAIEDSVGFCLACGAARDMCEPDARRYECEDCGLNYVYGAEELVLMGYVD